MNIVELYCHIMRDLIEVIKSLTLLGLVPSQHLNHQLLDAWATVIVSLNATSVMAAMV